MNLQQSTTGAIEHPGAHSGSEIRLQGTWLVLARIAWVVIALFATGLLFASLTNVVCLYNCL